MTRFNLKTLLFLGATILLLVQCRKDRELPPEPELQVDYDTPLLDAIDAATDGAGVDFLQLPESTDYDAIPQDPTNVLSSAKVELGKLLFHESGLGLNPRMDDLGTTTYSCASCHHAWAGFQANKQQGIGEGGLGFGTYGEGRVFNPDYPLDSIDLQPLRTPSALNVAYQEVMLWNGQFGAQGINEGTDDLWPPGTPIWNNQFGHAGVETQAIAGLTVHRMALDEAFCDEYSFYEDLFDIAFSEWPEVNRYTERTAGLAIAAFERTLLPSEAPYQQWLQGDLDAMSDGQKRGAEVFFGDGNCSTCHNGPALNSRTFFALGMNDMEGNGTYGASSANDANRGRGSFTGDIEDDYKFKTPQLYNLKDSQFFGHGGTFTSVRDVIEYKNEGVGENSNVPSSQLADDFLPLDLTTQQIDDLVDFIENALYDANLLRYVPSELPSGNCIPNNDPVSIVDQGCVL